MYTNRQLPDESLRLIASNGSRYGRKVIGYFTMGKGGSFEEEQHRPDNAEYKTQQRQADGVDGKATECKLDAGFWATDSFILG